ncbi:hypothetical protein OAC48_07685 [Porticoccaceae bacterium]|nr:hypothetical protein [Porticoccaceae bacterium]
MMINRIGILVILLLALANQSSAEEALFTEKVLLLGTHDPRHITFIYNDGEKLTGVHVDVKHSLLWDLDSTEGSQWFDVIYSKDKGLTLKHLTKPIEFKLISQVTNHPIGRILKVCYEKVGGSSMGIQRCLDRYDKLLEIEIDRAYQLLKDNGEDVKELQESWQKFNQQQSVFIRNFYSKVSGSKWAYKSSQDIVKLDISHLNTLSGLLESLYINSTNSVY